MLGKIEGRRRRGRQAEMDGFTDMSLSKLREMVKDREAWRAARGPRGRRVEHDLVTEQ